MQQLFLKIFTPLGVIVLDSSARATPGPHPLGGGQLPDSVGSQLNKPKNKPTSIWKRKVTGPHPLGGGQLPDSSVSGNPLRLNRYIIYLEEWSCPKSCQGKTFQNVDLSCHFLLPHRV